MLPTVNSIPQWYTYSLNPSMCLYNSSFCLATNSFPCYRQKWHLCYGSTRCPWRLQGHFHWHFSHDKDASHRFHKAASESLWGETLKSHNNPWDTHRGMRIWPAAKDGDIAVFSSSKAYCRQPLLPATNATSEKLHATTQKSYLFN